MVDSVAVRNTHTNDSVIQYSLMIDSNFVLLHFGPQRRLSASLLPFSYPMFGQYRGFLGLQLLQRILGAQERGGSLASRMLINSRLTGINSFDWDNIFMELDSSFL